ncbi:isochorismatase family cysteine hydrolase [Streptomyces sp. NPDC003388]|uniref:isochorismatase family cysteine hydrolase n=1 Tax=Streptomyces sp. 1-11 TaxID=2590549 RepID=UPI00116913EA|nr:isochorismatase family cysteine hydrolase [Streptomyces sp. 1-11]GEK01299.1 isochorismatase [Streptomyces sp. 1-11]
MATTYDPRHTAVLLVDPYNDFLSEGGKVWPRLEPVARAVGLLGHLRSVIDAARESGVRVVFVPHRRWEPGDYETWDHPTPSQRKIQDVHHFARGTWGGEFHPDFQPRPGEVVVQEHWGSSGFANTDLDMQLKQHGISHVVLVGVLANTCVEATGRFAMELGYHVTLVTDATAAFSPEMMHAAHRLNGPTYAQSLVTTDELVAALDGSR